MSRAPRSLSMLAAVFVVLFFGAGLSSAHAWQGARFSGRSSGPRARVTFRGTHFRRPFFRDDFRFRSFHRPFFARHFVRPFVHRPFRFVRVFVSDPFPRWVYRRVYYGAPVVYGDPYCAPY